MCSPLKPFGWQLEHISMLNQLRWMVRRVIQEVLNLLSKDVLATA